MSDVQAVPPDEPDRGSGSEGGVKVFFNPFAFDIETNNEFIRRGYEVMPIRVPL